nr:MAG TPA: hypothetical protein [Caudoviricetes sp.]
MKQFLHITFINVLNSGIIFRGTIYFNTTPILDTIIIHVMHSFCIFYCIFPLFYLNFLYIYIVLPFEEAPPYSLDLYNVIGRVWICV